MAKAKTATSKATVLALAPVPPVGADPAIQKMELLVADILKLAKTKFDDFVAAKQAGKDPARFGVTGMSRDIAKQMDVGPLFTYQIISAYMTKRGDVASQKGRDGGIVLRSEFEANQQARQQKTQTNEAEREQKRQARRATKEAKNANQFKSKFTESVKHLGFTKEHFVKAKTQIGDRPTYQQLKDWIAKNPIVIPNHGIVNT